MNKKNHTTTQYNNTRRNLYLFLKIANEKSKKKIMENLH